MQIVERVIIRNLIETAAAAGYLVAAVWDGEAYQMNPPVNGVPGSYELDEAPDAIVAPMSLDEALAAIDSVDESTLHFTHANARTWGNRGALLILGNGEDVISDYHCGDDSFTAIVDAVYERINDRAL